MAVGLEHTWFAAALAANLRVLRPMRCTDPQHRSIIVIDVAGFGRRTDLAQLHTRVRLDDVVRAALRASGIPRSRVAFEDRGDGMILFVLATVSKAKLLDPFIPQLKACLHA